MLNKIFFFLNIFLVWVFYSYSFYFSSLVLVFSYLTFHIYSNSIPRNLLFIKIYYLVYLFSFPLNASFIITEMATRSHPRHWGDNNFIVNDFNFSYVLTISFLIFFLIIFLYTLIDQYFSNSQKSAFEGSVSIKKIGRLAERNLVIKLIKNNKYLFKILLIPIPFLLCYFMDYQGWGVHGVPPREENFLKLVGITIYTRNFILPLIILFAFILGLMGDKKISLFWFLWLILISAYFGLSSLSRAVFITYAGVTVLICAINYIPKTTPEFTNILRKFYFFNFKTIFSILLLIFGFALISNIRGDIIYKNPYSMSLTEKHVAYEIFVRSFSAAIENISMIFQYNYTTLFTGTIGRFLGFYELSAAAYYINDIPGYPMFVVNFLNFNPETAIGYVTARELTDSTQSGGVGVDIITNLYLCGPYIIFGLILISSLFLLQRIVCNQIPNEMQNILLFIFTLLNVRYFIDGEIYTQSIMTIAAYLIVIMFKFFQKII